LQCVGQSFIIYEAIIEAIIQATILFKGKQFFKRLFGHKNEEPVRPGDCLEDWLPCLSDLQISRAAEIVPKVEPANQRADE
jgi:hypothetical protein